MLKQAGIYKLVQPELCSRRRQSDNLHVKPVTVSIIVYPVSE